MMRKMQKVFQPVVYLLFLLVAFLPKAQLWAQDNTTVPVTAIADDIKSSIYYRTTDMAYVNNDVYVVGSYEDQRLNIYNIACYWKNGAHFPLTDKDGIIRSSEAKAVTVNNVNDVYIIGHFSDVKATQYSCWKNGKWMKDIEIAIPDGEGDHSYVEIIDAAAFNDDLYILFTHNYVYYVWKNGKVERLEKRAHIEDTPVGAGTTVDSAAVSYDDYIAAQAIKVYNGDVYIAGTSNTNGSYYKRPVYWKNGQLLELPLPVAKEKYAEGEATDIFINDKGVWVSGYYKRRGNNEIACYWENGQLKELSPWYASAYARTLYVQGGNVYVAGRMENYEPTAKKMACYWKNGQVVPLFETDSLDLYPGAIALVPGDDGQPVGYFTTSYKENFVADATYTAERGAMKPVKLQLPDMQQFSAAQVGDVEVVGHDVFAMGSIKMAGSNIEKPVIWKNGVKQVLSMPANSSWARAFHLAVEKDDWLVIGQHNDSTAEDAAPQYCYWRNGVYGKFDELFTAVAAKIVNGDVYVVGYKAFYNALNEKWFYKAWYYKNDKGQQLALPKSVNFHSSYPFTIEVKDGKVYIGGAIVNYDRKGTEVAQQAVFWVNGVCTVIPSANPKHNYTVMQVNADQPKLEVIGAYYYYHFSEKTNKYIYTTGSFTWQLGTPMKITPIKAPTIEELKLALGDHYEQESFCEGCHSTLLAFKDKAQTHTLVNIGSASANVYMLNGKVQALPMTVGKYGARNRLNSLTVRNGKAYIGGSYFDNEGNERACYWADGKRVELD